VHFSLRGRSDGDGSGANEHDQTTTDWSNIEEQFEELQEQAFPRGLRANEHGKIAEFKAGVLDRAEVAHTERLHRFFPS
jgi:hypothetical protein